MTWLVIAMSGCQFGHHAPSVFERAQGVRQAIRAGQYGKAERALHAALAQSRVGRWHFAPFAAFIDYVAAPYDKTFEDRLDAWVEQDPADALPRLVRANYHYNRGWWIRGYRFAGEVGKAHSVAFQQELDLAQQDIDRVIQRAPDNPYARYLALLILKATGDNQVQLRVFRQAIARFPNYYPLYLVRLDSLQPKWGGSVEAMKAFVHRYAGAAPAGSSLKMLNLALYARLMSFATQLQCDATAGIDGRTCFDQAMASIADEALAQSALRAIHTFARRKDVDGVVEIEANLNRMVMTPGGEKFAVRFLQAAADALHSSTELLSGKTTGNNYAVDKVVSLIWYRQGNVANALTWDKRALADLSNTHFADPLQARAAKASIYRDMLSIMNRSRNYAEVAADGEKLARLMGGYGAAPAFERVVCAAQLRLKQYNRALRVCTAIIDASEDWQARFFRAQVYDALNRDKLAIDDYQAVADSSAAMQFRTYAAIAISVIYDKRHRIKDALDTLNGFASLFTPQHFGITSEDLAPYYNNLCYNKMQLGLFRAALADCNTSLRYGDIPDAVAKQQQLLRRLGAVSASHASSGKAAAGAK
ncbi:DUF4034 domain-containing protein [Dyella sp. A6]|uniref:DUF4034 domain-containing protein n=1 Tax=Dyella aluminiiresistens TaxID=3069105 RepID=UPI002E79C616|nr:DUF4034 domain-containing protein [Dyella sp. A6]